MKVNLRKAAALQSAIRSVVDPRGLSALTRVETSVEIGEFVTDVEAKLARGRAKFEDDVRLQTALIEALFEIRNKVAGANARAGVNKILAEVEKLRFLATLEDLKSHGSEEVPAAEIEAEMKKAQRTVNSYGRMDKYSAQFGVQSADEIESAELAAKTFRKDAKELEDSLLGINVGTEISLSDEATAAMVEARIL